MKKVLLSAVAVFAFVVAANAQDFGIKVGGNVANLNGDSFEDSDSKFNFIFGVFGEFMLNDNIGLQPELVFSGQGAKYTSDFGGTGDVEFKQKLSYVNIPVLFNYYLGESFYLQAGPYLGFLTNAEANVSGSLGVLGGDNKDAFKSTDFGAMIGLGANAGKLNFGLRYQLGLTNIIEEVDGVEGDAKNGVVQVALGFKFIDN